MAVVVFTRNIHVTDVQYTDEGSRKSRVPSDDRRPAFLFRVQPDLSRGSRIDGKESGNCMGKGSLKQTSFFVVVEPR